MFCCRDKEATDTQHDQVELITSATGTADVCLDATLKRKRSSEAFTRGSFFPCKRHENQVSLCLLFFLVNQLANIFVFMR